MHTGLRGKKNAAALAGALILVGTLAACSGQPASPNPLPTWTAPTTQIQGRAAAAGLQLLPEGKLAMHIHTHLAITLDGRPVTVPAHIGIDTKRDLYSELHTHDTSGIIHVEAGRKKTFYLRQFFAEWGVKLTSSSIGQYVDGKTGARVAMFVNGNPYTAGFDHLPLANKTNVTIAITTDGSSPQAAPAFKWPSNY